MPVLKSRRPPTPVLNWDNSYNLFEVGAGENGVVWVRISGGPHRAHITHYLTSAQAQDLIDALAAARREVLPKNSP